MSKKMKQGLVPELRFPEFRDSGEWQISPLKKLATSCTEKNRDGNIVRVLTNSAEHGIVDQRDYFDKDIAVQGNLEGYFIVKKGDFVYNPRISSMAPVGPISKNNIATGVMSPLYTVFRFNSENDDYYVHFFKTTVWHHYMRQVSSTGARHDRMAISKSDFIAMPIPTPPVQEEQQKIADCLSSLDELITVHTQKHQTLQSYKKGLLQNLFPAEGETLPALRFPEFEENGDWVLKKGMDITTKITKGASPKWQGYSYQSQGIAFITSENVRDGFLDISKPKYLPVEFYEKQKSSQLKKGDILINIVGASIGRSCLYSLSTPAFTNQAVALFRVNNENSYEFVHYCYQHDRTQNIVSGSQSDSARPNLSLTDLKEMDFILPSLAEQRKIACCLSTADILIAVQAQKIKELEAHKKGLMQQLFPATGEVTA